MTSTPVIELRVALTVADYERIVELYCLGLGVEPAQVWHTEDGDGHGLMLELGRGTLEIFNEEYAAMVDQLEAGSRVSGSIRFAFQVPDVDAAVARLIEHGAVLVGGPLVTPWGDRNARLRAPDGMQITVYEVPQEAT